MMSLLSFNFFNNILTNIYLTYKYNVIIKLEKDIYNICIYIRFFLKGLTGQYLSSIARVKVVKIGLVTDKLKWRV